MVAKKATVCEDCRPLHEAAEDGQAPFRLIETTLIDQGLLPTSSVVEFRDGFAEHPEGPSLDRRAALHALAEALTKLAIQLDVELTEEDPEAAFKGMSRWARLWAEIKDEWGKALRREVNHTEHGHSEVLVSLPIMLPTAIKFRRHRDGARTYGPFRLMWWPYRYPGGFLREIALEVGVLLMTFSLAAAVYVLTCLDPATAIW